MDYTDFEPMHKYEYINDLWEYEYAMMTQQEIRYWAELGYKTNLDQASETELKERYEQFVDMIRLFEGKKDAL